MKGWLALCLMVRDPPCPNLRVMPFTCGSECRPSPLNLHVPRPPPLPSTTPTILTKLLMSFSQPFYCWHYGLPARCLPLPARYCLPLPARNCLSLHACYCLPLPACYCLSLPARYCLPLPARYCLPLPAHYCLPLPACSELLLPPAHYSVTNVQVEHLNEGSGEQVRLCMDVLWQSSTDMQLTVRPLFSRLGCLLPSFIEKGLQNMAAFRLGLQKVQ